MVTEGSGHHVVSLEIALFVKTTHVALSIPDAQSSGVRLPDWRARQIAGKYPPGDRLDAELFQRIQGSPQLADATHLLGQCARLHQLGHRNVVSVARFGR